MRARTYRRPVRPSPITARHPPRTRRLHGAIPGDSKSTVCQEAISDAAGRGSPGSAAWSRRWKSNPRPDDYKGPLSISATERLVSDCVIYPVQRQSPVRVLKRLILGDAPRQSWWARVGLKTIFSVDQTIEIWRVEWEADVGRDAGPHRVRGSDSCPPCHPQCEAVAPFAPRMVTVAAGS
jgi:hypothetical protein